MVDLRPILLNEARAIGDPEPALLLSGGVDSLAVLFALLETGHRPVGYTFGFEHLQPTEDMKRAEEAARIFGIEWHPVWLPTDPEVIKNELRTLARFGAKTKTDFECSWPMITTFQVIQSASKVSPRVVTGGVAADGHFCLSKKGLIHWKHRIDEWRWKLYRDPASRYCQRQITGQLADEYRIDLRWPFFADAMVSEMMGTTWDEVNRPRQKDPILRAFPEEFKRVQIRKHLNYQLGDSGIAAYLALTVHHLAPKSKSPVAAYNRLVREENEVENLYTTETI